MGEREGERVFQRLVGGGEEILEKLRGEGCEGFLFLPALFLRRLDLLAQAAGLFPGEGVGDSLGEGCFLRVVEDHVRPRINLDQRMRPADEVQAGEKQEQMTGELIQGRLAATGTDADAMDKQRSMVVFPPPAFTRA